MTLRALVGPTASGKTEAGIALAIAESAWRSRRSTRCWCTGGWTSAPPNRPPRSARVCPTTCSTSRSPRSGSPSPGSRREAHDLLDDRGAPSRSSSAGRASTSGRWSITCGSRRRTRPSGLRSRPRPTPSAPSELYARLAAADPVAAARIDPANVRRTIRALEVPTITGAPFSRLSPRPGRRMTPTRVRVAGVRLPATARSTPGRGAGRGDAGCRVARGGPRPDRAWVRRLAHREPGDRLCGAGGTPRR